MDNEIKREVLYRISRDDNFSRSLIVFPFSPNPGICGMIFSDKIKEISGGGVPEIVVIRNV